MMLQELKAGLIIPPEAAPLRAMTVTMTVMCYLACLALGGLLIINRAVDDWTQGLSQEITVQIRDIAGADTESEVAAASLILKTTTGILTVTPLDQQETAGLLEPWLGTTNLEGLPIPRIIRVTVDEGHPPDFAQLEAQLVATVKGASLDTHRRWQGELTRTARALSTLSVAILVLICLSAIAMVVFATRTVLDANSAVVDVLHLIGARDSYIARQIDYRFLVVGFISGVLGLCLGMVTFVLLSFSGTIGAGGVADATRGLLFANNRQMLWNYAAFLAIPLIATLISLITARLSLVRMLEHDTTR